MPSRTPDPHHPEGSTMSELDHQVPTREKVLVVGAGPAGLAAAAALQALEVPFDLVDRAEHVGGIWNPQREDSPIWSTMEMISSRAFTQYEDMLQPVSFPEFLRGEQMAKYLRAYAARYNLTEHFRPGVEVRSAHPFSEGVWQVELSTGEITIYRAIIAAHGTSERPYLPDWTQQASASTRVIHAKDWTSADGLEGQRVLVVGSGQSAADIAVDAARRALEVRWSVRTGHWVVPRRIGPVAGDVAAAREPELLGPLNERIASAVVGRLAGDPSEVGLPAPTVPLTQDRVIVSDTVLDRVREGRITPIGEVTGITADGAITGSGDGYRPDLIVLATGYRSGADYLPDDVVPSTESGAPDLFLGAFPRHRDDLVILGQVRVSGGILPVLVEQADIAAYLMRAVIDESGPLEEFRRIRAGGDASVHAAAESSGRLARLWARRRAAKTAASTQVEPYVPFTDREQLLGRLRTVRGLFA